MKIHIHHMYHGAALIQIAESPQFTAINSLRIPGVRARNAYKINDNIGIHLKYASRPSNGQMEYPFTFSTDERRELEEIGRVVSRLFIALVCVQAGEICCLPYDKLCELVERRKSEKGGVEEGQYVILVTAHPRQRLRAYVKAPGKRRAPIGEPMIVERNEFPRVLFDD